MLKRFSVALFSLWLIAVPNVSNSASHALTFVKEIGVPSENLHWMSFVSFSPDGKTVASDGPAKPEEHDGYLTFWSFPEGKLKRSFKIEPEVLSGDWKYFANSHDVGRIGAEKPIIALGEDAYAVHAFSRDSRHVAESGYREKSADKSIRIVELPHGKETKAFGKHHAFSLAFSPDGKTLASGHWDLVTLWDIRTGRRLAALRGFGRYVEGLSFSKNGRLLAASTDAGSLQIWDVRHRRMLHAIRIGGGDVSTPAFSPDGRLVAVGIYGTGAVWLIDVKTGRVIDSQKVSGLGCGSVAFSPNGRYLITPSTGGLIKWPYDRGGTIRVFRVKAGLR